MRKEFLQVETEDEARQLAPWAAIIVRAEGGWLAFESQHDYEIWEGQK